MLLNGINHIAWLSKDAARLGRFYAEVFDAEVGPTRPHRQEPGETMTVIRIGPHTELNIFVIEGNTEAARQIPMWGRGRIDHVGLQAASPEAFRDDPQAVGQGRCQRRHRQRLWLRPQHVLPRPGRPRGRSPYCQALTSCDDDRVCRARSSAP
jgi:hypothetical protein